MSLRNRGVLRWGDQVRLEGVAYTVTGLSGVLVRLADPQGESRAVLLPQLMADSDFAILTGGTSRLGSSLRGLDGFPDRVVEQARWWEHHLVEVISGLPPEASPEAVPRSDYDPTTHSLAEREAAKADELTRLGFKVSPRTLKRRRQRYETEGLVGLVDRRVSSGTGPGAGNADPRLVEAIGQVLSEAKSASTRTVAYALWRTGEILREKHGEGIVPMPSRATFYRLFELLSQGQRVAGTARARKSLASRPEGPFDMLTVCRPGEVVEIDSTPLDVLVLLPDGVPGRVEMTGMVDLATRTITAAVLRPTTKSVDASLLLAKTVTPEPMRPGWTEALRMSRSVLPHQRLLTLDERLAGAAAKPVIVPEVIVCDHGKAFISQNFRSACRMLGIDFQPAHEGTPTDKPHIERTLGSVASMFAQFVSGYVGRSPEHRGDVDGKRLWSLLELQELLDEWIVAKWQNRKHDELRDPATPGRAFSPNEKYAALVEASGYVPVALTSNDYIELLPATWRAVNSYGIRISRRTYDSPELNPFRRQRSGVAARKNLWEIHYDPYDVSRIWVRNHWDGGGWITVGWTHLRSAPMPFGEMAWDHARQQLPDQGRASTEEEIAEAVAALLRKASAGPEGSRDDRKLTRRDRRVAARTKATSSGNRLPLPEPPAAPPEEPVAEDDHTLAKVIPLGVFDPFEEAKKRW
ncbi:DDE-type integrase/transposase/recombinase [Nonomuraea sp. NN258]|uniref:Mu transposase C-terminal domain-containing protein n=1 Tax=Nonomuraea antri TaxID=2730852 RepID=UPI0015690C78|nr:Mu transposase C-terminal domain-containing protein [Nonomuraea antri]NRQ40480.1 DDE-type integrase/transposase/recombinase [Nonomuraea antri]